jgi:hypothetical protein
MDHDEIREHIESAARQEVRDAHRLTARLLRACWPGGSADRSERAALAWIARWRPERTGAPIPACSCATGRCDVCN